MLTGEVKMPDKPDGRSPFQQGVVEDAHQKANAIGVEHNFTWNVNRFVLWKTFERGKPITERSIAHWDVLPSPIQASDEVTHPRVQAQIDEFLLKFLEQFAGLLSGERPMVWLPLDEKFIAVYESSLESPVRLTLTTITRKYLHEVTVKRRVSRASPATARQSCFFLSDHSRADRQPLRSARSKQEYRRQGIKEQCQEI